MNGSLPNLTGGFTAFVAAYKQCRKVQQAEAESEVQLARKAPLRGFMYMP